MAEIVVANTQANIQLAREIRKLNVTQDATVDIQFSADNTEIHFSGEIIYVPDNFAQAARMQVLEGEVVTLRGESCVIARERAKTVNVHLDSELVAEVNAIRDFIAANKNLAATSTLRDGTQHEILLAMLRRGIEQFKGELGMEQVQAPKSEEAAPSELFVDD